MSFSDTFIEPFLNESDDIELSFGEFVPDEDSWTEFLGVAGISFTDGFGVVSLIVSLVTVDSLDAVFDPLGVEGLETLLGVVVVFGVDGGDLILSGVGVDF